MVALGWLLVAHLVADFVLQSDATAAAKHAAGRRALRALIVHAAIVAVCLLPFALAFGAPGVAALVAVTLLHAAIDLTKTRLTRRAEAEAVHEAAAVHEAPAQPAALGIAWTAVPAALFLLDQAAHAAVLAGAWWIWLRDAPVLAWFADAVARLTSGVAPGDVHRLAVVTIVGVALVIVNVRAGALFVALLLRPERAANSRPPAPVVTSPPAQSYRITFGGLAAKVEPQVPPPRPRLASPGRVGAAVGILERLLIVMLILAGAELAIGLVIAAKTLARFKQLDDREFAEYYLLGTLASVAIAVGSAIGARAVLGTL